MAVRLRLTRLGRTHRPFYRICAFDSRTARDGRSIEILGHYNPLLEDLSKSTEVDAERVKYWLSVGALPTGTVASILRRHGIEVPAKVKKKKKKGKPVPKSKAKKKAGKAKK